MKQREATYKNEIEAYKKRIEDLSKLYQEIDNWKKRYAELERDSANWKAREQ